MKNAQMGDIETINIFKDFIRAFVRKQSRERILYFLERGKKWWLINHHFHSSVIFNEKVLFPIKPKHQFAEAIYEYMLFFGCSKTCISLLNFLENKEYKFDLEYGLNDAVGHCCETILFCPDKMIAYYEGGHPHDRYILRLP